ncbi:nucleotidyltransferase domain-containing protein [Halobacillus fulvus]|nr:nucleotidyltransferase domain-containing protein [Halobacillus fulvus]
MKQWKAVHTITESLKKDPLVKAVYLKGSLGRGEEDKHSDVDLYVLVEEEAAFLKKRYDHIKTFGEPIFYDDIFIIAPQVIAVYSNLLHLDLFTVTEGTLIEKDYYKVLYDPDQRMQHMKEDLTLSDQAFLDAVDDVAFFLLQYKKAAGRGNAIWANKVVHDIATELAKILLHHYCPERAQLGLKDVGHSLSSTYQKKLDLILTSSHSTTISIIIELLEEELEWLTIQLSHRPYTIPFLKRMMEEFSWTKSV